MSKAYQCLESSALPPHLLSPSPSLPPALSLYTIRRKEAYSDRCQVQHLRRFTGGAHQSEDFEFWVLGFGFHCSSVCVATRFERYQFYVSRDTNFVQFCLHGYAYTHTLRIEKLQFCPHNGYAYTRIFRVFDYCMKHRSMQAHTCRTNAQTLSTK